MNEATTHQAQDALQTGLQGAEMKELVVMDETGNQTVSARELHLKLGVGRDFSNWIKDRIEKYGFLEGKDYQKRSPNLASGQNGGQNRIDYFFTLSAAKELAMVENNDRGRAIRQYLIKVEEAWNTPELVAARALKWADSQLKLKDARIAEIEWKKEALQIRLSEAQKWYSVKRVLIETGKEYPWRPLKQYSDQHGYAVEKTFDTNYGEVNAYHGDVWHAVYGLEL
jgi:phage anti-repressor protein